MLLRGRFVIRYPDQPRQGPEPDGDTVKGSFMLTAVPAWAACFGFAFDGLRSRFHRFSAAFVGALVLLSLVGVPFLFAASRL